MTTAALTWGCAFLAFGPSVSLLFFIAYEKAQLIIVVTTAAFAFLLSSLGASMLWWVFDAIGWDSPIPILVPGVLFQFALRCGFVWVYHKVERVIEVSIARHEEREEEFQESAKLRLELNDWACGVAAGTGFGGMHAILLYGTLLASEAGNLGTLYQESCPEMPSLVLSALNAFIFSLLDLAWMLLTFFGMRQRLLFPTPQQGSSLSLTWGAFLGNSRQAGNYALGLCLFTHACAAAATTRNRYANGCQVSLPLLVGILVFTTIAFWGGASKSYLPPNQRRRVGVDGDMYRNE